MEKSYDLNLGNWGPYNKEYAGATNIADKFGTTFNVEMFPGFFRRNIMTASLLSDDGVKPIKCNSSRTNYTYRYELEWKDKVYVDVNYNISNDKRVDIKCNFVNNTDIPQSLAINLCASLQPVKEYLGAIFLNYKPIIKPKLMGDTKYINAIDYEDIKTNQITCTNGFYLGEGEVKNVSSFSKTALVGTYFNNDSHFVKYNLKNESVSSFGIRYKADSPVTLKAIVDKKEYLLNLEKTEDFKYYGIEIPKTNVNNLTFIPSAPITIDSVCYGENAKNVEYEIIPIEFGAEREIGGVSLDTTDQPIISSNEEYLKLYYKQVNKTYIIKWDYPISLIRRFYCDDIAHMLSYKVGDHVNHWWRGAGEGVFDNIVSNPIYLEPNESKTITFTVFEENDKIPFVDNSFSDTFENNKYAKTMNLTKANLFLNTVYPIYSRRSYIRHNTPGRLWNCLYTWDSGLIGVGLGVNDFNSAFENLKAYLTPINDKHSPCILSGSLVPTQILLYKYLFDNYPNRRDELKEVYFMVKQIYDFYVNLKNHTHLNSNLLSGWFLNYNSGGWDDYPPQKYMHSGLSNSNASNTTPVITSAFTVLCAKILKEIANYFGYENDFDGFINKTSLAIENLLWDDNAGYYSYLVHDENGNPKKFLTHPDGSNYNQGFDGVYPVISGISNTYRTQRVLNNIKNGLLTDYGISVVDTRASYFSKIGYWNGSVWVPHGWILWNALLDLGEVELLEKIAKAYLDKWADEVEKTYSFFENFMLINGRGAGFHNFSGLSSPILDFYASYFTKNKVSCGFETLILTNENGAVEYQTEKDNAYLLICTNKTNFKVNGKSVEPKLSFANAKYVPIEKGKGKVEFY